MYRFHDGSWTNFDENSGLQHHYIWSVLPDVQGNLLAGTWGGSVFQWNGSRFEILPELKDFSAPVTALLAVTNEGVLIGTGFGLMRYEPGKITWLARERELALPDVRTVVKSPDGTLWFGMSGGGLGRLQRGSCDNFAATMDCPVISCNASTSKTTERSGLARSMG